ncbi:unnamed protein product [Blepharisma stoltei]|uniref:Uncharacterized protein n=1 Tax=Blepharisma stoltei TaxID=1481888 RepID=A0AAU9IUI4_9CILI|nr:unnamed protein product [Blepharisma stoltei]
MGNCAEREELETYKTPNEEMLEWLRSSNTNIRKAEYSIKGTTKKEMFKSIILNHKILNERVKHRKTLSRRSTMDEEE